jgi:hypothetical protein
LRGLKLERTPTAASHQRSKSWRWLVWASSFLCLVAVGAILYSYNQSDSSLTLQLQQRERAEERWAQLIELRPLLREEGLIRLLMRAEAYERYLIAQEGLTTLWLPDQHNGWWIDVCNTVR